MAKRLALLIPLLCASCVSYVPQDFMSTSATKSAAPRLGSMTPIQFAGDLSGDYSTQNVLKWRGKSLDAATMGAPTDAQIPIYVNGSSAWKSTSMSGDVTMSNTGVTTVAAGAKGITQLTNDVTAGPGSGSQSSTVVGLSGSGGIVTMSASTIKQTGASLALTDSGNVTRNTFSTGHGLFTAGGGGSDWKTTAGPAVGAETTDASVYLLGNAASAASQLWQLDAGTQCQNFAVHAGSVCLSAPGSAGAYGDVVFTNANGTGSNLEMLGYFDGVSGLLMARFGVATGSGGNAVIISSSTSAPVIQSGSVATSLGVGTNNANATLNLQAGDARAFISATANGAGTSVITVTGSTAYTTRSITGNLTIDTTTKDKTVIVDTSSGGISVTLPTPTNGREIELIDKKSTWGTNNLTLVRFASEKIDNVAASRVFSTSGARCKVWSDGTDWYTGC